MQGGLNCRPETERTCPKSKPKSQKSTRRKLSQCHESSFPILATKQARYHPYLSQSGHIQNTNTTPAFRYDSCPPCPTQQTYPFDNFVYPQPMTVPTSPQDECARNLRSHQLNGHCVNTSQANLNIGQILQDSAHHSNTFPNPATQGFHNCRVLTPQPTIQDTLTKQRRLRLTRWPIISELHSSSHYVDASTGEMETHENPDCAVEYFTTRHSSRSDGNSIWCLVCGGLLGVACSGHHARIEVDGGG